MKDRRAAESEWPVEGCEKNSACFAKAIKKIDGWKKSDAANLMCDIESGFCVCKDGFFNADEDAMNGCESEKPTDEECEEICMDVCGDMDDDKCDPEEEDCDKPDDDKCNPDEEDCDKPDDDKCNPDKEDCDKPDDEKCDPKDEDCDKPDGDK